MLPGWDKLQDLREKHADAPDAPDAQAPQTEEPKPDITQAVADAADRITAVRVVTQMVREGRKMSLLGKMAHLTETAQDFHKETETVLDGIAEKIATGRQRRNAAAEKHHAYYDAIIKGIDESTVVIDRLSNGPLHEDGQN